MERKQQKRGSEQGVESSPSTTPLTALLTHAAPWKQSGGGDFVQEKGGRMS